MRDPVLQYALQEREDAPEGELLMAKRRHLSHVRTTEVDAYVFIKENLRTLGWDTRNPERVATGQVYTQNECLGHPEIRRCLVRDRPENIVKVRENILWVIEAKRSHSNLATAVAEAQEYAQRINEGGRMRAAIISGVAGNELDTFLIRTHFLLRGEFVPVQMNGFDVTGLLSLADCNVLLDSGKPNIDEPPIDERLFISRAEHINEILHLGAVNPHQRASVMSALLLSMLSSTVPNIEERSPTILIEDINIRVRNVLRQQRKPEFEEYIRISLPASQDNHVKFRKALVDTIQELNNLNIRSAMNSGADWLGAFYEVFLKYASWAQDLGIVLTPRHITRFVADVMGVRPSDIVYDPTCGTGGFLVAAFDCVKRTAGKAQLASFKRNSVFGIEQDSGVAALAVVNMIFRGDGKNNIHEGNCFAKYLKSCTSNGVATARYVTSPQDDPPVTKVMMNPPFALRRSDEKEYKFIDQALRQMQDGGILFTLLPYSTMVRTGAYRTWRKEQLLSGNTLLAVVTFPEDIFYPVAVTTVGVFVKKGIAHDHRRRVLWMRALTDGLLKRKGKRLPHPRAENHLELSKDVLRAFLDNPNHRVANRHQYVKACPIDFEDALLELVPEAFLDQAQPSHEHVLSGVEEHVRNLFAYLVKIDRAVITADLATPEKKRCPRLYKWKTFKVTDLFELGRGHFHSIADLDPGTFPTISRVGSDNGFVGFYGKPHDAEVCRARTLTVSSVSGHAFIQPVAFLATDNVVLCLLKEEYCKSFPLTSLVFAQFMINEVKWRYSYGRQCYTTKFETTQILLPVTKKGRLDTKYMDAIVRNAAYWQLVEAAFEGE